MTTTTQFNVVPLQELHESKYNPRRRFDETALKQLAENIGKIGVLVPLLVRPAPNEKGGYEILDGARRYRAAKLAKVSEVPVRIQPMTDEEAVEAIIIANLQREDLHPLEEAEGFRTLLQRPGYDMDALAEKIGYSVSYVYQRLKLAELVPKAKEAFLEERITAGHAILLARLQPKYQEEALGECFEREYAGRNRWEKSLISVRALGGWIAENIHLDLHAAPWKKDDATLVPKAGPCTTCPKRTGFAPALFPDIAKKDTCTDRACFGEKQDTFLARVKAEFKKVGTPFVEISREYTGRRDEKGPLDPGRWDQAKAKSCPHAQAGLVVGGTGRGQVLTVCAEPKCKVHGRGMRGPVTSPQQRTREKKTAQRQRLEGAFRAKLLDVVLTKVPATFGRPELGLVARGYIQEVWHENRVRVMRRRGWIPEKGRAAGSMDHQRVAVNKIGELKAPDLGRLLVELSLVRALDVDSYYQGGPKELLALAKRYKVNLQAVRREITKPGKPGRGKKK